MLNNIKRTKIVNFIRRTSVTDVGSNQRIPGQIDDAPLKDFREIPGPPILPLIGSIYKYFPYIGKYSFDDLLSTSHQKYLDYGPIVRETIMKNVTLLHIYDPNDIEIAMRYSGKYPERRSHLGLLMYRQSKPDIYKSAGIIPTNGVDWWKLRSIFQKPLTSPRSARVYLKSTDSIVMGFVETIKKVYCKNDSKEVVDFLNDLGRFNLQLIMMIVFGDKWDSFTAEEMKSDSITSKMIEYSDYVNSQGVILDSLINVLKHVKLPIYKKYSEYVEYIEKIVLDLISNKLKYFNEEKMDADKQLSVLENYLSSPDIDFKDIVAMCIDLIFGGIDTTSYATSFALYNLTQYPEVQERLFRETLELLPNSNDVITEDVLNKVIYLKAFLKESLRIHPVSLGLGRLSTQDIALSGYRIPAGTTIVTQNQVACSLERYCENANIFMPERWIKTDEDYKPPHLFLSIPFGHGARTCIARRIAEQNIHLTLLRLVRSFKISWTGGKLGARVMMLSKPDSPIKLKFQLRDDIH